MRPNSYRTTSYNHQQPSQPQPQPQFTYQSQYRPNSSTTPHSRSKDETREERDLRLALLASQEDHQQHLIELERRERLMMEKVRNESEVAELDRKEIEKVRLASIEESERKILERVLRESQLQSPQQRNPIDDDDDDQYQLELALAISLNESSTSQGNVFENSSSKRLNNLHHLQTSHPAPLRSTQSASTLEHSTSRSSFTTALTGVDESDTFNHAIQRRSTETFQSNLSSYQSSSSFIAPQNTRHSISPQECPPPYDDIGPSIASQTDPQSSIHFPDPSGCTPNHSPPQSLSRDHALTPTGTRCELQSNHTIRRHSRPLPKPPSRPNSQAQPYPLDPSNQRTTSNDSHSLGLSTPDPRSQSPSMTRVSLPYSTSDLISNLPATPIGEILNPFEDCYAASPIEHEDLQTSLMERPALLIRTRSDQFVSFPDFRNDQEHHPTNSRSSSATQSRQEEEEEDEAIKEALIRARRASNYSASFIVSENEECDIFGHRDETPIQSPSSSTSFSDNSSRTFVCNPKPSGSLSDGIKYGRIGGLYDQLDSGQFPDLGIGINF
ncbi:uncharacterized protein MELLADRAFT_96318 [Melampsora larici-populina 98AG31]|uniref:Uncharacterized protein n=1 Tax=Melampsora larici-populina (strain 98AG31 / pathotype 3-4-7) TaxID=747676 RepID=F4REC3_MELLP|nr:uncharacterized protein MELLADRAFT_96318 [Melampsora larici-populina 98AG31]EGG09064.1 hypothetical protein MELLADRAFT_96318 [Melampsora larici-populina 98AG31]